jgi:predicted transcriptional regulator
MPKMLTIRIPDELEQQLEEQATDRNITLEEVILDGRIVRW